MHMKSPKPLTFKYSTMVTTVTQNAEDYEAVKIEQTQGPGRWQVVELMPDEVDSIMSQIETGNTEGVVTHVSDITNKIKFTVSDKGIALEGWATDNSEESPVGEPMRVALKRKDFEQIQGWMVRYDIADRVEECFQEEVLRVLGYNKN